MPNADTMGSVYRLEIEKLKNEFPDQVLCIENFGKVNYFSAMKYAKLLIGNTSSGILEAASFGKFVINVGDRQKGRTKSENIIDVRFDKDEIVNSLNRIIDQEYKGVNIYLKKNTAELIIKEIKEYV
jgi:GDP/UDP-N,N'-diacetylbacillosamine 2-epimerase (hydrolysing)